MSVDDLDTSRSAVKTYVPAYQKDEWATHAEDLDMSQSEFVRTMVQAGRKSFDPARVDESSSDPTAEVESESPAGTEASPDPGEPGSINPSSLDEQVVEALTAHDHLSWDELLAEVTDDIEERLESALDRLQRENRVGYRGRHGGYALLEDDGQ